MQTDPIADFLTRIRNGLRADHDEVEMPSSRFKAEIARILQEQGYIDGFDSRSMPVITGLRSSVYFSRTRRTRPTRADSVS